MNSESEAGQSEKVGIKACTKTLLDFIFITSSTRLTMTDPKVWDVFPADKTNWFHVTFDPAYTKVPNVVGGISHMDISMEADMTLRCYFDNPSISAMMAHLDSWGNTILYGAGMNWIENTANSPASDTQVGSKTWPFSVPINGGDIIFDTAFTATPKVVAWIAQLDISESGDRTLSVQPTNAKNTGFTMSVNHWGNSRNNGAVANWIAIGPSAKNIYSGQETFGGPGSTFTTTITYPNAFIGKNPQVFVAFSEFDIYQFSSDTVRMKVYVSNEQLDGCTINVSCWSDSKINGCKVVWVAYAK